MGQLITNIKKNKIFQDILIQSFEKDKIKSRNNGKKEKIIGDIIKHEHKNN